MQINAHEENIEPEPDTSSQLDDSTLESDDDDYFVDDEINFHVEEVTGIRNHLTDTFLYKLKITKNKLNSLYPRRHKRGLINALGSVIKFVAGNPDQDDIELIQHNLGNIQFAENHIIKNQNKQIKINNELQKTVNKVSITVAKIVKQLRTNSGNIRKDVEEINLILNLDIIIQTLEDIEEQFIFSKSNILNKNILSSADKDYIIEFFKNQGIKLHFEDQIFKFVNCIAILKDDHVENEEYDLIQLETTNINRRRINLDTQYVAKYKKFIYKQSDKCVLCDNTHKLNDGFVYNILTNQAATCNMSKDNNQIIIRDITPGIILLDSRRGVHVLDSCGDDRIIEAPTIIETENCTVKILNQTFLQNFQTTSSPEFSTPIFGKQKKPNNHPPSMEEIHQVNLENLEELTRIRLQLFKSQTIGGFAIASITIFLLIVVSTSPQISKALS
ncbi:uncharacterized protein LOC135708876, partial [Ochlerotatus camptorhynchus]|uniref:uncharacterized protein LOC135708876 n=1 Tax=Ochlerotatus camptorhynchus TaxID=644619 RepID=UPI0031CE72B0